MSSDLPLPKPECSAPSGVIATLRVTAPVVVVVKTETPNPIPQPHSEHEYLFARFLTRSRHCWASPTVNLGLAVALLFLLLQAAAFGVPQPEQGLRYTAPATVWDEAFPLGNGLLGALVWGDGAPLKISLDRTDLWDLRPVPEFHGPEYSYQLMRKWVGEGRLADLRRIYEDPYGNAGPTRIPAGRIELEFAPVSEFAQATLSLADAQAAVRFLSGVEVQVMVHAEQPIGVIRVTGPPVITTHLVPPSFGGKVSDPAAPGKIVAGDLASLGYSPPQEVEGEKWTGFKQEGWGGFSFAVALAWQRDGNDWLAIWSVATSAEGSDPLQVALDRCRQSLASEETLRDSHLAWWRRYWSQSRIRVPNALLERQWYLETYKFGSAARRGAPPISLQGPWTADNGKIPPWKGDYHHDLNTELCYWPCYSGNHLEEGLGFLDWLWDTRDQAREWTRRFFAKAGLNVPMTADLKNDQIGGWHQYTHSATTGAWLAHHFYLHWKYSQDREFLTSRAYPFMREVALFLESITEKGPDGFRTLPLSSSPEINDNRLDAWFPTITNYDLSLIRWLLGATAEIAEDLGHEQDAGRWRHVLSEMPALAVDSDGSGLLVARGFPLIESHRHFSHLMGIYPLGLFTVEGGADQRRTILGSLAHLDGLGSSKWTGYSFSWLSALAARARDGARAERALEIFSSAFCLRNSFHCNGDQSGKGYSDFTYRPFTLEGNFAAAAALQEMCLQSYGGVIRVFPAIPAEWQDASFQTLRAEGAFLVSAMRKNGKTVKVEITPEQDGLCRIRNPFEGVPYFVEGAEATSSDSRELRFELSKGRRLTLYSGVRQHRGLKP